MASLAAVTHESPCPKLLRWSRTPGQQELHKPTSPTGSSGGLLAGDGKVPGVGVLLLAPSLHRPRPAARTSPSAAWEGPWDCTTIVLVLFKII